MTYGTLYRSQDTLVTSSISLIRHICALLCAGATLATASLSAAQSTRFSTQLFRPTPAQTQGLFVSESAQTSGHLHGEFSVVGSYGYAPLTLISGDDTLGRLVTAVGAADVLLSVGISDYFELGLDLPILFLEAGVPIQGFREIPLRENYTGLGDIRVVPKVMFFDTSAAGESTGVALGLSLGVGLPTGDVDSYAGTGGVSIEPTLNMDVRFRRPHRLHLNAGYAVRPDAELGNIEVGDAILLSGGAALGVHERVELILEGFGHINLADDLGSEEVAFEGLGGVRARIGSGVLLQAAGGTGITGGAAAADWRVLAGVGYAWAPRDPNADADGDGIRDRDDACRSTPEDIDGYADEDGCPEDNDRDGIADGDDECPLDAEDFDGVEDEDGCPDEDVDEPPVVVDPVDTDGDGLLDTDDDCPLEPEDFDEIQDADGCPEVDADADGILDEDDTCPLVAESANGWEDSDGCSDVVPTLVVLFDVDSDDLSDGAKAEIAAFAELIADADGVVRVEVVGHTDDTGSEGRNDELSEQRARAVSRRLEREGVSSRVLSYSGVGSSEPVAPNTTDSNRARNRRVNVTLELEP